MRILYNDCHGGLNLSEGFREVYPEVEYNFDRDNEEVIDKILAYGIEQVAGRYSRLCIANIPDEATDWDIFDYDGLEMVIYILDSKINFA